MFFIGIDWAEKHLDYCIENNSSDVIKRGHVDNDDNGFNSMLFSIGKENIQLSQVAVAIESPHQHVVDFLLARGVSVYPAKSNARLRLNVNPAAIHDYRKSRKPSGSKSDSGDAQLIASYLSEHHKTLRAWRLPEPKLRQLKLLVSDRDKVVQEKVRLQNQQRAMLVKRLPLRSTLIGYFPAAIDAFGDITCPTSLVFLSQCPTFEAAKAKTDADWQFFLDEHRVFNPKARQGFLASLTKAPIAVDEAVVNAKSLLTQTIVSQLRAITAALKEYDKRIKELLLDFSDGNLFRSLPGVDIILAAKLLVAMGTDRERFWVELNKRTKTVIGVRRDVNWYRDWGKKGEPLKTLWQPVFFNNPLKIFRVFQCRLAQKRSLKVNLILDGESTPLSWNSISPCGMWFFSKRHQSMAVLVPLLNCTHCL